MSYQILSINKTQPGTQHVTFENVFASPPIVLVSSYWSGSSQAVGFPETVISVTASGAQITSQNFGPDYFLNVLAIDAGASNICGLDILAGAKAKKSLEMNVSLARQMSSPEPCVLLSSSWNNPVAFVDTVDNSASSKFSVVSGNLGQGYTTNYMAIDFKGGGNNADCGIANKTGIGRLRVYFSTPFSAPPVVLVSPWWDLANQAVQSVPTITLVTNTYFEVVDANGDANYFMNWFALAD